MNLFDLTGKRALITGGTHGLGMSMAKGLAVAGAELIINGHSPDKMEAALNEYAQAGFQAKGYLFDVTNDEQVKQSIDKIEKEVGPIDILINNAGIIKRIPMAGNEHCRFPASHQCRSGSSFYCLQNRWSLYDSAQSR